MSAPLAVFSIAAWMAVASIVAFIAYALDKRAARRPGHSRIAERTLHQLALAGGWPGAWLAQRWLRHKNRKPAFQRMFRLTVVVNLVLSGVALYGALNPRVLDQPSAASMSLASDSGLSVDA